MRISSSQLYQSAINGIARRQATIQHLQNQINSTKKIQVPSDDPIAASAIHLLKQRISSTERLKLNVDTANGTLGFEESALSNGVSVIQDLRRLQVSAGDPINSPSDRLALATEAENLLAQLKSLANTQDSAGNYIFSGSKMGAEAITQDSTGKYIYNGDQTQRFQGIAHGMQVAISDHAFDIFMNVPNGNGVFSVSAPSTPNLGTVQASTGSVTNTGAYVADQYTVKFAQNSQSQWVVLVDGASSGAVIPPSGLVDDAPLYQSGQSVSWNGMEITLSGDPVINDSFVVKPSTSESIFSTVSRMITNLKAPATTPADKAKLYTENQQVLKQLDAGLNQVLLTQSQVGARMNQLDVASQINTDLIDSSSGILSSLEDTDFEKVIPELSLQTFYLEIAQKSFMQTQGMSVFNFM
jgi:flagellar hook-associated protein 3 FlgL